MISPPPNDDRKSKEPEHFSQSQGLWVPLHGGGRPRVGDYSQAAGGWTVEPSPSWFEG